MTLAKLPPLPRKPRPGQSQADADRAVNEAPSADLLELRRRCLESAIGKPDEAGHVHSICASCGEPTPWWQSVWGKWNSGHTAMIMVPPRPGDNRWKRFAVAVYVSGRTCVDCSMELEEWRRVAEPTVTVDKNGILSTGRGQTAVEPSEVKEAATEESEEADRKATLAGHEAWKKAQEGE